ncbi:trypsin delta-like [Belonocnema kinseyi]|uniref:trypsin delta-like n=1 Tax=Belonocnema kinseyi TaxID=2817044 RepID=UPI00143D8EA3|nr:trypsin delta-like [Belonocnema kinseyi]
MELVGLGFVGLGFVDIELVNLEFLGLGACWLGVCGSVEMELLGLGLFGIGFGVCQFGACTVHSNPRTARSIGGAPAQVTYQAALLRAPYGTLQYLCGGSIVSGYFVLTAAHCVYEPVTGLQIRAGTSYWSSGGSLHTPRQIIIYPGYINSSIKLNSASSPLNDLALIEVNEPFIGPNIAVVNLFVGETPSNIYGTVSGWGYNGNPNSVSGTDVLQAVSVIVYNKKTCKMYSELYNHRFSINYPDQGQICGGTSTTAACRGDSGSPLVYNGAQIGIVSYGGEICGEMPSYYTEVSYYASWIKQYLR